MDAGAQAEMGREVPLCRRSGNSQTVTVTGSESERALVSSSVHTASVRLCLSGSFIKPGLFFHEFLWLIS